MKRLKTKPKKRSPEKGPCFSDKCKQNGCTIHHCATCEAIHGEDAPEVFRVQTCQVHFEAALKKVRRHALTKHPVNILRFVAAGLKGELLE